MKDTETLTLRQLEDRVSPLIRLKRSEGGAHWVDKSNVIYHVAQVDSDALEVVRWLTRHGFHVHITCYPDGRFCVYIDNEESCMSVEYAKGFAEAVCRAALVVLEKDKPCT